MPVSIYGQAHVISPALWASWIVASVVVYLVATWRRWRLVRALGTLSHLSVMLGLAVFSLTLPHFSPVAPWTVIFSLWLFGCLSSDIEDIRYGI